MPTDQQGEELDAKQSSSPPPNLSNQLCTSCDGCRARKTKCDGQKPCEACVTKYVKQTKKSKDLVTAEECGCTYSMAKRRGPAPGFKARRKVEDGELHVKEPKRKKEKKQIANMGNILGGNQMIGIGSNIPLPLDPSAAALQQQILSGLGAIGLGLCANFAGNAPQFNNISQGDAMAAASNSAQQQLGFIERLQRQQQQAMQKHQNQNNGLYSSRDEWNMSGGSSPLPQANDVRTSYSNAKKLNAVVGCEKTKVLELLPLLLSHNPIGMRFRASYTLSFGSMFQLPPILGFTNAPLPKYDTAALQGAQFAELAIGAMVDGQRTKMHELTNASILCLQDSVKEPLHPTCRFEVAKAFFFHSLLRCYNGDMERFFKYRRVAMNTLAKLDNFPKAGSLIAAMSFHDTLSYMLYGGSEDGVPDIDYEYPQVSSSTVSVDDKSEAEAISPSRLASSRKHKFWISKYLGFASEGGSSLRLLDAFAHAIRSYIDESNFTSCINILDAEIVSSKDSAEPFEGSTNVGHHMLAKTLHVLDKSEESQAPDLLSVLQAVVNQPLLLYQGGCTHLLVHKCALLTAHLINKLHENCDDETVKSLLDEAIDTYNAVRVVINAHSVKMPSVLRCSDLPRPYLTSTTGTLIEIEEEEKSGTTNVAAKLSNSAPEIEKECDINDKSFLVFLSGCF